MKTEDELMKLTKIKLEEYGRTLGIELDRRKRKDALVKLLLDVQELCVPKKEETFPEIAEDFIEDIKEESQGFFAWLKKLFS